MILVPVVQKLRKKNDFNQLIIDYNLFLKSNIIDYNTLIISYQLIVSLKANLERENERRSLSVAHYQREVDELQHRLNKALKTKSTVRTTLESNIVGYFLDTTMKHCVCSHILTKNDN